MYRFLRQIYSYSRSPLPLPLYICPLPPVRPLSSVRMQSLSDGSRRLYNQLSPDCSPLMLHSPTDYPRESFPPESPIFDSDQLLFGPLDMDDGRRHDPSLAFPWDATGALPTTRLPPQSHSVTASPASSASLLDFGTSPPSSDFCFTPGSFPGLPDINPAFVELEDRNLYSNWLVDDLSAAAPPSASVPIIVSSAPSDAQPAPAPAPPQTTLIQYVSDNGLVFPKMNLSSPSLEYASLHPLPRSVEESPMGSISPPQISQPSWAAQLFLSHPDTAGACGSPLPQLLHPPDESDSFATQRPQRGRNYSLPAHAIFQSSSAPSGLQVHTPPLARGYSRRAESASIDDDHDGTVRRKRKVSDVGASMDEDRTRQAEGDILFHDIQFSH
jgi:hypothetical protein